MFRKSRLVTILTCLTLASLACADMVHQDWDTGVGGSRQAIIDFLVDLVNPEPVPDVDEVIDESLYRGSKDNYVAKFYGWVTVPESGDYQFHYSCDDYGMLYVSQDEEMANAVEVAWVDGWAGNAEWDKYPTQHSEVMSLKKGQQMALMAFYQEAGGGDNMDIGWTGPGLSQDVTSPTYLTDYISIIPPPPTKAKSPSPENGAIDVDRDTMISWVPGKFAAKHNVYLSTNFDDVNEAAGAALVAENQDANSLDPGRLEFGQTYYLRVDEVNSPPDRTIYPGKIWEFTIEPHGRPITGITAPASSSSAANMGPEKTIDGSGLNGLDQHGTIGTDMWLSGMGDPAPTIQYDFDKVYKLDTMLVWNSNQMVESFVGLGAKDVVVETSVDGAEWTVVEGATLFNQAPGAEDYTANTTVDFGGILAQAVRITISAGWGFLPQYSLSEVRILYIPTFAREPQPAPGSTTASANVELGWRSGREAASSEVYLGTDAADLALLGTTTGNSIMASGLNYTTTYFWSVTEINDVEVPTSHAGDVWSFTTPDFGTVDDFDQYNDLCKRIFFGWEDGLGHSGGDEIEDCDEPASNGNGGGSMVGHDQAPFAEKTIVRPGSSQSLPVNYDNAFGQSETTLTIPGQDWTASGIKTLAIAFAGTEGNTGTLYIKINSTKIVYDGAAADIARGVWQAWNVDLTGVSGLQNVTSLTIGVDGASAAGMLYFDDIRLYPLAGEMLTPAQPANTNLVAHYTFDEGAGATVGDSSGNGNNGTVVGVPQWVSGKIGGAMLFSGFENYVDCGDDASLVLQDAVTVACWIKVAAFSATWETIVSMGDDSYRMGRGPGDGDSIHFGSNGIDSGGHLNGTTIVTTDTWRHAAIVYDGTTKYIYIDGFEDARKATSGQIDASSYNFYIAENAQATGRYLNGAVDDLRVYGRALSPEEVAGLAGLTDPVHKQF